MKAGRIIVGVVLLFVALDLVLWGLGKLSGGTPGGPTSSWYATGSDGIGAWADLLVRNGHTIARVRKTPSRVDLPASATAVVLDPPFVLKPDAAALLQFVQAGGRLVAGGPDALWLASAVGPKIHGDGAGVPRARPLAQVPEVAGVTLVRTAAEASWQHLGHAQPILGRRGRPVAAVVDYGRGRIVLLSDDSMLQNSYLGVADNARFALDIAGPPARPVLFFEGYHGFGSASGTDAVPGRWDALIALGIVAALLYMLARGRRLGPPERTERDLEPPRREYVEAVAGILVRKKAPAETLAPLRAEIRARLQSRAGPLDTEEKLFAAAQAQGLSAEEAAAVAREATRGEDVLPLGRALARLGPAKEGEAWRN